MAGKPQKPRRFGSIWRKPPKTDFESLNTSEKFPGKAFAIRGARWLNATMKTNIPLERRKDFAKNCFQSAIDIVVKRLVAAREKNDVPEVQKLEVIRDWLKNYKNSI